jgi:hypothetical protein
MEQWWNKSEKSPDEIGKCIVCEEMVLRGQSHCYSALFTNNGVVEGVEHESCFDLYRCYSRSEERHKTFEDWVNALVGDYGTWLERINRAKQILLNAENTEK